MSDQAILEAYRIADMSALGLVHVAGADAAKFLHAQLSNDVQRLEPTHSELAAWCDAKGRALAVMRVLRHGDGFMLIFPATLKQALLKRLKMFVLRAQVELFDASEYLSCCALFGAGAEQAMAAIMSLPAANGVTTTAELQCLRLPGAVASYLVIGKSGADARTWERLQNLGLPASYDDWLLNRINAGEPQVVAQTQGVFVPQMLNLHWLDAIDFQKGCYPGQEIVARLQYRGTLARRMYLARMTTTDTPAPGDSVTGLNAATLGQIVAAAPVNNNEQRLLAVLKVDAELQHANIDGVPLTLLDLPYETPA